MDISCPILYPNDFHKIDCVFVSMLKIEMKYISTFQLFFSNLLICIIIKINSLKNKTKLVPMIGISN